MVSCPWGIYVCFPKVLDKLPTKIPVFVLMCSGEKRRKNLGLNLM